MARFFGKVGFAESVEISPGYYEDKITVRKYYGDVIRNVRKNETGEGVIDNVTINNSISIVADEYINGKIFAIRFVEWMGALWKVTNVEVQRPRLILSIGDVYNGPT